MTDINNVYLIACKNNYNDIIDNINLLEIDENIINDSLKLIVINNNINLLNKLYDYNLIKSINNLLFIAVDYDNLNILEWLHNKYDINEHIDKIINYIIINKKYTILNWLHKNNYYIKNYINYILDACNCLDFNTLYWFRDNGYLDKFYNKIIKNNKDWISYYKLNHHAKAIIDWFDDNYKFID